MLFFRGSLLNRLYPMGNQQNRRMLIFLCPGIHNKRKVLVTFVRFLCGLVNLVDLSSQEFVVKSNLIRKSQERKSFV